MASRDNNRAYSQSSAATYEDESNEVVKNWQYNAWEDEANSKRSPPEEGVSGPSSPPSVIRTEFKTEPEVDSPALFSMPATPVTELVTTAALETVGGCVSLETVSVSCSPKQEKENVDKDILAVGSSVIATDVESTSASSSFGSDALCKVDTVAGDFEPRITLAGIVHTEEADRMCTKDPSLSGVHDETSTADAAHSKTKSESTSNSFENIDRVEESKNSNEAGSSAVWQSIGKSIFEVASPVAKIKGSEQNVTLPACLFSIENDATPKDSSALRKSVTSLIDMEASGFGYSSVLSQVSDAAAATTETLCHQTSNLGLSLSATKSKLVSSSCSSSRTSIVFSSSTVPSLLRNFDELTSIAEPTAHKNSQEDDKKEKGKSQVDHILAPKHTNFPMSAIYESTASEITSEVYPRDDITCGLNDYSKTLCTGASENDRPSVEFDNPLSNASTVLFELKSIPMSIDSESSPENPYSDDLEPVSVSNPSGAPLYDNKLLSDSSQRVGNVQGHLSQTSVRALDCGSSDGAKPCSGPRSVAFTVRCTRCSYTSASLAQLESHVRELHPDYFSQTMRSSKDSKRIEHSDSLDFMHRDVDERDVNVANSLPLGARPRHSSVSQQKIEVVMGVRNNQSAHTGLSRPSVNQTQSDQVERHCTQGYAKSQRFSTPSTVNVSLKGGPGVSQPRPSVPHTLLMRVPQLRPSQRMETHSPSDMRGQHDARGFSSSTSWQLALRNPLQPPQFGQSFPAPHTNPQLSPQSNHGSQFHQLSQPRSGPIQLGFNRNISFTTSYSNSVASTRTSELERSSQLPQTNYVHMMNRPAVSTALTTSASAISQPPGNLHLMAGPDYQPTDTLHHIAVISRQPSDCLPSMAGANLNRFAGVTANAGVRMSLPSPVHSSHTATNNLRVQPVRVGIFPRCNEKDLETVRLMAYPSVSGSQNLTSFPSPLDFSDPPNFSQPPQPLPFLNRSPSASARLTIQPESERKFTCPYCYMILFGRQTLFDHVAVHANNDRSTYRKSWCPYCTLKCGSQQQLVNHFKSHTAEEIG